MSFYWNRLLLKIIAENKIVWYINGPQTLPPPLSATEEQLIQFASYINEDENYQGKYIVLTNDITLTKEWIPAGSVAPYGFSGNFLQIFSTFPYIIRNTIYWHIIFITFFCLCYGLYATV